MRYALHAAARQRRKGRWDAYLKAQAHAWWWWWF